MIIKYKNTMEDYKIGYEKNYQAYTTSELIRSGMYTIIIAVLCIYHIYEMSTFYNVENTTYIIVGIILFIAYLIGSFINHKIARKKINESINKFIQLNPQRIGEKILEINEDTIIIKNEKDVSHYNIQGIDSVDEKDERIILYTQKISPIAIIPCIAFDSEQSKNQFLNLLKK